MKLTNKILKAINIAADKHFGQKRKNPDIPYIVHPYAVACILSEYTENEDVIAAGLLHDVLEDVKGYFFEDMVRDFGIEVAQIVKEVTEDKDPNNPGNEKETWKERKENYIRNLENDSQEALMVCAADKLHNLISLSNAYYHGGDAIWKRFNGSKEEKIDFYRKVLQVVERRLNNPIVDRLNKQFEETCSIINSKESLKSM